MPDGKVLTLRQADNLYRSFPDFSAWPAPTEDDLQLWNQFASRLEEMRKKATPEALRKSVEVAVRALSIPFLVFANQRKPYFEALHQADLGETRPLLAFFLDRGIDTLQLVIDHLLTVEAPGPESIAARIRLIDDVALRLLEAAKEQIKAQFENLNLLCHFDLYLESHDNLMVGSQEYRQVMGSTSLMITIEDVVHDVTSEKNVTVLIARDLADPFPLYLVEAEGSDDYLEARFEDAHPEISEGLRLRLTNWCRRLLGRMLKDFERSWTPR